MDKNELIHEIDSSVLEAKQVMLDLMENGGSGHIGGSLSIIDALMCLFHTKLVDDANYLVCSNLRGANRERAPKNRRGT